MLTSLSAISIAQENYPDRPIKIVVGFNAGSSSDVAARLIGQKLSELMKVSVVVENKPGASSEVGARFVASSPPDGYTVYLNTVANSINFAAKSASFMDVSNGLHPVAQIGEVPNIMVVTPSFEARSVADVIRLANASQKHTC
mgnify:CR=1 FL=1